MESLESIRILLARDHANKNKINTARVKDTTARKRAVVSENKGIGANAVKASACWGNPQQEYREKGVFDSGYSRHMTGNKCYLIEYEDYDGGFVSFGNGKGPKDSKEDAGVKPTEVDESEASNKDGKDEQDSRGPLEQNGYSETRKMREELLLEARQDWLHKMDVKSVFLYGTIEEEVYVCQPAGFGDPHFFDKVYKVEKALYGNQTNGIVGTRDNIVAGQAEKKTEPEQEYILIPIYTTDLLISQGPKDSEEDAGVKPTEVDESEASDKYGKDDQDTRSEFERLLQQEKQTEHPNSSDSINTVSIPVSTAEPSFTNDAPSSPVNAARTSEQHLFKQFSPFKNSFTLPDVPNVSPMDDNTGIFDGAYDDEEVGGQADLNNFETTMNKVIQALEDPRWIEAMQEELLQFKHQKVWTLVDLPNGKRAIGTKYVFKNKKDERGIAIRNKARRVAQGYTQEEGIDYDEVFAPVARIEVIRLFLAYASFMGFIVYQMDVKSAFLYGTIEEEVYVCQPPSFEDPQFPDKVYKVEKALYGLHQAPSAWYETLSTYLLENGFRRCTINKTLFIKKDKSNILLVQVYVDDIIFGSTKKTLCLEFEQMMHKRFQMSSMGELTFFLGLQVQQKEDEIFISQDKYVADILKKFNYVTVKTTSTPMKFNKALVKDEEADNVDVHLYRSMIRSLMYLIAFRPDITFAVCACARFQVTSKTSHLHAVKRIFRYLKGQPKLGLWYPRDSPFDLEAFS
ncbi:putative ribonuclease H-like domain-containing protein, partial [Tanacetum coccineum]